MFSAACLMYPRKAGDLLWWMLIWGKGERINSVKDDAMMMVSGPWYGAEHDGQ